MVTDLGQFIAINPWPRVISIHGFASLSSIELMHAYILSCFYLHSSLLLVFMYNRARMVLHP